MFKYEKCPKCKAPHSIVFDDPCGMSAQCQGSEDMDPQDCPMLSDDEGNDL